MSRHPGIRRKGAGWQAKVTRGTRLPAVYRHFPLETPLSVIQAWRDDIKATLRTERRTRAARGQFAHDAERYLRAVKAMPTYHDREREIRLWIREFGDRPRHDITATDIRIVRDRWLTAPRSSRDTRPVSPATVNKRLRALANLYTVLDGRRAPNPARDVPEADEPTPRPRALDYATIGRILDAMRDSDTKVRVRVLAYTGWPTSTLQRLSRADVDFDAAVAHLPARRKGAGAEGVTVPLVAPAVAALRDLDARKLWGTFDGRAVNRSFQRAAKNIGVTARLYDLRHSFLTLLASTARDERAVQALAQHGDIRTTRRYTEGSLAGRVQSAITAASLALEGGALSEK